MANATSWVIELHTSGMDDPIQVSVFDKIIIGRGGSPDLPVAVDLSPYQAVEKGVSRQHLSIELVKGDDKAHLVAKDLRTPNGTMFNEKRMQPDTIYPLTLGESDRLMLGTLELTIRIISKPMPMIVPQTHVFDIDDEDRTLPDDGSDDDKPETNSLDAQVASEAERAAERARARAKRQQMPGHGELVLIVEDHNEVAQHFSMMLQRQGFTTQISRDANRALHYLQGNKPDAIILDLMLPAIDGLEVCRYIRRDTKLDKTPVLIVSAKNSPETQAEARRVGADKYLTKPINVGELGKIVAELIEKRRDPDGTHPVPPEASRDSTRALDQTRTGRSLGAPPRPDSVAVIIAGHIDNPATINVSRPVTFGRTKGANTVTHFDLSPYRASDLGVSRVHFILSYEDGQFYIEDTGSLNGTYISGQALIPHQPTQLFNGQEIRAGQLTMYIYFLAND